MSIEADFQRKLAERKAIRKKGPTVDALIKAPEERYGFARSVTEDPRPDLAEDSKLWGELLRIAAGYQLVDREKCMAFAATLNYLRGGGTRLVAGNKIWVLRPEIDCNKGWQSQEEYDNAKTCLNPYKDWIPHALSELTFLQPLGNK
ncbi:hypothetical protein M3223_04245 [Paenibacillus pasadenensis]|uniref:hypothetical protein n=1 Tax=Paenibacillus pasadenensis TaxID=217090 RepID=UPI00203DAC8A|nr:hypothetical protein [Paenibacillus pasadenensis]MCM3746560.1 hypothetical protein [Paenibacillus pasadenensis]